MKAKTVLFAALAAALTTAAHAAPNPVGSWTGHMHVVIPASYLAKMTPQQKAMMQTNIAKAEKSKISLSIKADHTFTTGADAPTPNGKKMTQTGKWTISANTITLTVQAHDQKGTLDASGKTLTVVTPFGKAIFVKS